MKVVKIGPRVGEPEPDQRQHDPDEDRGAVQDGGQVAQGDAGRAAVARRGGPPGARRRRRRRSRARSGTGWRRRGPRAGRWPRCRPDRRAPGPGAGTGTRRSGRTRRSRRRVPAPAPAASAGGAPRPAATDRSGAPAAGAVARADRWSPSCAPRVLPLGGGRSPYGVEPALLPHLLGERLEDLAGQGLPVGVRVRRRGPRSAARGPAGPRAAPRAEPMASASSMLWVTKTIVLPVARQISTRVAC